VYEQVVLDVVKPPQLGARLLLRPTSMDPAKVNENAAFFSREVLPRIKAQPGYLALRNLVNRTTGEGVVGSVWESDDAIAAAAKAAEDRRSMGEQRGITFGELMQREVVFGDLP
jgi:heme-degrading monooxygenase HmoA